MARGRPSRRAQIDSSNGHSTSPSRTSCVAGAAAYPRSTNRETASEIDSGGTGQTTSPGTSRRSRLVARILMVGQSSSRSWARRAAGSMRCSQLSSTMSVFRPQTNSTMRARSLFGSTLIGRSSVAAIADGIPSWSFTSASSTSHTSICSDSWTSRRASIASRVFPTPPGPTRVTNRRRRSRAANASSRSRRPTSEVSGVRSLERRGDGGGSGSCRTVVSSWWRIAASRALSSGDGTSPTSSAKTARADSYERSASVGRPDRDNASIS